MLSPNPPPPFDLLTTVEPFLLAVWIAFLGACVGSFLNVVIYRLPRRISLVHPGSHCPACGKPIRWYHNLPVFGWLILKGRCRDCESAISSRYPIIEAITSALFLSVAWTGPLQTVATQGAWPQVANGSSVVTDGALMGYQLLLLCTVLCLAMIDRDSDTESRLRFPMGLMIGMTVAGLTIPVAWRALAADALHAASNGQAASTFLSTSESMAGGMTAILCAAVAWPAMVAGPTGRDTRRVAASSLWLVGLFLGPRPVAEIAFATTALHCLLACLNRSAGRLAWPLILFAVSWAWTLFRLPAMAHASSAATWQDVVADLLGLLLLTGLVSVISWRIDRKSPRP